MRANEFVTELFQPGKDWKWSFQGSEEAVAVFHVGEVPYMFHAYGADGEWEVEFKQHGSKLSKMQKFGLTGTGNSAEVMSTVVDIMRAFLDKYKDKISVLTFSANEDSRQGLYARMVKRLLPDWRMQQKDEFFTLVAPKQNVAETWGIEKYAIPLPIGDYLDHDEHDFAPPGNYKDVSILHDEVFDLIDAGAEPDVVPADTKQLLATQDWLTNAGGDGPLFDEYPDRPVVYEKAGKFYILDGHHRTTRAWKANRPISVYLFSDNQLSEELNDSINPKKLEILDHLKTMPLTVFGSTATKSLKDANDFDVFLDLDARPEHKKYVKPVLNLSYRYYGWIDPFVIKDGVLYVRNDTATGWTRSKNAQAILKNIRSQGRPIDQITENFADGKVKGKSRPGRVKRAGVSCNGSVTDLRARAKRASGEQARMYHWCANMKSGRNKNK